MPTTNPRTLNKAALIMTTLQGCLMREEPTSPARTSRSIRSE